MIKQLLVCWLSITCKNSELELRISTESRLTLKISCSFVAGILGNVALLTVVRQAYGKPSPSFLSICLSASPPPDDASPVDVGSSVDAGDTSTIGNGTEQVLPDNGVQDFETDDNNSSLSDNQTVKTLTRNQTNTIPSSYAYLFNLENVVSVDICLDKLAVEHCNSFYCPHSTVLFYTAPFIFVVLDILLSKNELTSAVCKCVCLCVCVFVSFDTVSRNMHDVVDVIVGVVVGVGSGKWFLKNIYSRLMVRNIAILNFTDHAKHGSQEFEIDFARSEEFSVF